MAKKGSFAGWFRPSLQKARNGRVETGAAHLAYFHQIVRKGSVFRLGGVGYVFNDVLGRGHRTRSRCRTIRSKLR